MCSSKSKLFIHWITMMWWRLVGVISLLFAFSMISPVRLAGADSNVEASQPAPQFVPLPSVSVSTSSAVMLGDDFTITARFKNNGDTGYGPFIDLYMPQVGTGTPGDPLTYNGISAPGGGNYSAQLGTENLLVVTQTFIPDPDTNPATQCPDGYVMHPWGLDVQGYFLKVCGTTGDQLVSIQLPYGSYTSAQPELSVNIPAHLSDDADIGSALSIRARAGFIYGATPMVDWCCTVPKDTTIVSSSDAPENWPPHSDVMPSVVTFSKSTSAGELPTGPNNLATYTITVNVADGQEFRNISVTDAIPNNIVYSGLTKTSGATVLNEPVARSPQGTSPENLLSLHWDGPITSDLVVEFQYYVPDNDANGNPIVTGPGGLGVNNTAELTSIEWWPAGATAGTDVSGYVGPGTTSHTDKPITFEKGSAVIVDTGSSGATPGDIVKYTLSFRASDYFGFTNLSILDVLSDGQHYYQDATYIPKLSLTRDGGTENYNFSAANVDVACNYTGASGGECDSGPSASPDGTTLVNFDIHQQLLDESVNPQVLGDHVDDGGSPANTATTGTVTFYAIVLDKYTDINGATNLKMGDSLNDSATLNADWVDTATCNPGPCSVLATTSTEGAGANVTIGKGTLKKTIIAKNGAFCGATDYDPCTDLSIAAGDEVTYRVQYELLTGDFKDLTLTDFLPLPIFHADDPNVDGTTGWSKFAGAGVPPAGGWKLGPADTRAIDPVLAISPHTADNSIKFDFGSYDDPVNQSKLIDILFTVRVTAEKYGDGLKMRNNVLQQDANSPGGISTTSNYVDLTLTEPVLVSTKTVVSTDHTGVEPNPSMEPPVEFALPGASGAPWNSSVTPINSNYLDNHPLGSGIGGIDGGDMVKFAIVVENTGSGSNGAYDIVLRDVLPDGYIFPGVGLGGFNLQAYRGDGKALDDGTGSGFEYLGTVADPGPDGLTGTPDDFFGAGVRLRDPADNPAFSGDPEATYGHGLCQLHEATLGKNVIIVTYDLMVDPTIAPGTVLQNAGQLVSYSGSEGGDSYIPEPIENTSDSEIKSTTLTKTLVSTELDSALTPGIANDKTQVVIGELVTYQLEVTVPEGESPNTVIVDTLDDGLAFVAQDPVTGFTNSDPAHVTISGSSTPVITLNGKEITWTLGTVSNTADSNETPETLTFEYTAVVLNDSGNQNTGPTHLNNSVEMTWDTDNQDTDGNPIKGAAGPVSADEVTVIEPNITTVKTADPVSTDAGNTVDYKVTLTNPNSAMDTDAYEAVWSDILPAGLTYVPNSLTYTAGTCTAGAPTLDQTTPSSAPGLTATWATFPYNTSCELTFQASVDYTVNPGDTLTNTANTTWTSLPGDVTDISPYNTDDSDERTGVDGVSGALNDYASTDDAVVTITNPTVEKYLVATSEVHTAEPSAPYQPDSGNPVPVAIGEIVRYRLVTSIPEGTSPNFQVNDRLPAGLIFLDDGTAKLSFISDGGITSSPTGTLPVPAIPTDLLDPPGSTNCNALGTTADATTPASLLCTLADENIARTMSTATNTDNFGSGDDVFFKLGDLVNNDSDSNAEYVVIEFNALMHNSATNRNDAGDDRANFGRVYINGIVNGNDSTSIDVRVVEPHLTIDKQLVSPAPQDAGDPMTYTISISNDADTFFSNASYAAPAFDLNLSDVLDTYLDLQNAGDVVVSMPAGPVTCGNVTQSYTDHSSTATDTIDIDITCLNPAETVEVSVTVYVRSNVPSGYKVANTATVTGTSLPGPNGTTGNVTGSNTPGTSGTDNGERDGSDTDTGGQDDYYAASTVNHTLDTVQPVKSIVSTDQAHTSEAGTGAVGDARDLAIGETVRYRLSVELPEGTSPNLSMRDTLPAGFGYVDDSTVKISFLATTNVTAPADLAGADNDALPPTFTLPAAHISVSGQDVTFDVGTIVNNDSDADAEYVVIEFDVRVNDDADSNNTDLDHNDFDVLLDGMLVSTSNETETRIVEPLLNITKTADDGAWIYGQTVTYTLTVSHEAASLADAFDIVIEDVIPSELTYTGATVPAGWETPAFSDPNLTLSCLASSGCSLAWGDTATITITATVNTPATLPPPATDEYLDGTEIATNVADLTWTSLPGSDSNERNGTSGDAWDDYSDTASHDGGLDYYAIGNRVWFDTDNNGHIDAGEVGVDGVTVELYKNDGTGSFIDTGMVSTTANGGYYLFDYLGEGEYIVALSADDFTGAGKLVGYYSAGATMDTSGAITEAAAPDVDNDATDSDDNGTLQTGVVASLPITLGPTGATEPTGESDLDATVGANAQQPDGRANMTVDFGFYRASIGDQVYYDENFTGNFERGTDMPATGVAVQLYSSNGTEINVGPDGILGTSDDAAGGKFTNASGQYLFSNLPQGNYIVRVTSPANTASTIDTDNPADTAAPDTNDDNNDNGIGTSNGVVSSGVFSLTPGASGALNNNIVTEASGETYNPTVDFGFVNLYALGNRVWFDTDNSSNINGGEVGVDGVTVDLYKDDGTGNYVYVTSEVTGNGGYYLFDSLYPGNYVVIIPAANFGSGAVLEGYHSSATYMNADGSIGETAAPDPDLGPDGAVGGGDDDRDSDDNGTLQSVGSVQSLPVTLGPVGLTEPTDDSDEEVGVGQGLQPDGRANLSVDFGFYKTEIGNLVFGDVNKNGNYESGTDTLYGGVTVQLYSSNGTEINVGSDGVLGTADDAAGGMTTDASGLYLFSGLPAGDYIVRVVAPNGTVSTIDSFDLDDNTTTGPDINTDDNDNGQGVSDGFVTAGTLTMTAGDLGAKGNNLVSNATGTTTNPTVDFGFTTVYALGNRVWFDTNNDSVIDNGEIGVDGVTVELYAASDLTTVLDTDTTANGGYYLFNYLEDGSYVVVIPASNFGSGAVLDGYWSSTTYMNANGITGEAAAPGPDNDLDSDDNGTLQTAGTFNGAVISSAVTLGPGAVEPDTETDLEAGVGQGSQPNAQANMTVDFGFYTIQQGDLVWDDTDNSGTVNGAEVGIPGVNVQLWSADGSQLLSTDATDASGIYTFTGLPQGHYILRIPATEFEGTGTLRDYISSTGPSPLNPYEPAPDADFDTTDSDDNGSTVSGTLGLGGYIQSEIVTLTPVLEGSYNNSTGSTSEFRVDFGVYLFRQSNTSITKDDGQSFYLQGDVLTYTVVVNNAGPSDVTGAQVSDPRPAQIASWAWACTSATGGASGCDGATDNTSDFLDTVDLPINSSITYTVTANVDAAATGDLVNTATIMVPAGVSEIDTTNTSSTDTDTFASLNVTKSDKVDVAAPGYTLTYNILVENTGNVDLSNITVTDTLPDDVTFQSASLAPDSNSGGVLVWNGLSVAAGSSYSIDVEVRVNDTPVNPAITNRVEATDVDTGATSADIDTDTIAVLNDKTIVTTNVNNDTDPRVLIGEIVTYQISLTIPHGTLLNLQALDILDEGLTFDECLGVSVSDPTIVTTTLAGGFADACPADTGDPDVTNSGHKVVFDFGDVTNISAIDQIITVQYMVDVLDIAANVDGVTSIDNNVTWMWNGGIRKASAPPLEIVEPNLSIIKDASPSVALLGSTITFTIDIEHTDISKANAYDVVVTDQLPSGLEYIGNVTVTGLSYDRFNYDTATSTITFEWDTFPLLATSSITFEATFVGPPPVVNEASVAWTSIPLDPGVQSNYNPNSTERFYDPLNSSGVNNYGVTSSITINRPALPKTGFAPGKVTALPAQPKEKQYQQLGELTLEIPRLGVRLPIVGVPASAQGWDLTWLSNQAGWLEGTAYPTLAGNTGLTGHTYLADGTPGPFVNLGSLYWGDQVYIYADGNKYIYEVREVRLIWPQDISVLHHEDYDWITLITCREYNEEKDDYTYRVVVRAVLVKVEPE